jgi:hypothetical protein
MENGIYSLGLVGKRFDSFVRGQNEQIDFSATRLEFHLLHHRKTIHIFLCRLRGVGTSRVSLPRPRAGYVLSPRGIFSRLLLALTNPAAVNDDVTFISNAINFDSTEVKFAEVHGGASRFTLILSTRTRRSSGSSRVLRPRPRKKFGPHRFSCLTGLAAAINSKPYRRGRTV